MLRSGCRPSFKESCKTTFVKSKLTSQCPLIPVKVGEWWKQRFFFKTYQETYEYNFGKDK